MSRFRENLSLQLSKLINVILITAPFFACWYLYYATHLYRAFFRKGNWAMILLFVLLYYILVRVYDGLHVSLNRISEMVYSQALAFLITDGVMYIVICILTRHLAVLWPGLLCILAQCILSVIWGLFAHRWYFRVYPPERSAVVYGQDEELASLIEAYGLAKKFDVQLTLSVEDCLEDPDRLNGYATVFLSGVHSKERNIILKHCIEHDITMYITPRIGDVIMSGAKQMHMFHLPMLYVGRYSPPPMYLGLKRASDLLISALALLLLSPLLLITAIAIKATDGGPVFYRQVRLTKDGREFKILKFRSMRVDAEKDGVARLSTGENDSRITPVGRIIRKIRLDELPQLFNVLSGDMTLIGPRPERPEIAKEYEKIMPEFRLRLQAKAGLTGYAQVYGKYNSSPYDKLRMDLMYIANPSVFEDIRILFATVKILFMPESTEGVAEGKTTAL